VQAPSRCGASPEIVIRTDASATRHIQEHGRLFSAWPSGRPYFLVPILTMRNNDLQSIAPVDVASGAPLRKTLLALNNAHAQELSWLAPERLEHLVGQAFLARRIGSLDAFLLALDQGADYDSPNFQWFRARRPRFVYVDRIVIASSARGRGYARLLYGDLFEHAVRAGHERVVCEVNSRPANPESDAFHTALGFVEVGSASVYDDSRTVRYLERTLS
jgi:predicted GNAT superfamily acetyltransferase